MNLIPPMNNSFFLIFTLKATGTPTKKLLFDEAEIHFIIQDVVVCPGPYFLSIPEAFGKRTHFLRLLFTLVEFCLWIRLFYKDVKPIAMFILNITSLPSCGIFSTTLSD